MKKWLVWMMAICMLCGAACAEEAEAAQETVYQPLQFSFWADSASGYEWTCEYDDNGVLAAPIEEYVDAGDGSGAYEYYFGVLDSGKAEIFFNYGVNYGMTMPEQSIICTVLVDEQGANTVRWAEVYSDDHMLVIKLPGNPTTGWGWSYQGESENGGMVSLVSDEYISTDEYLEGAGGISTYQLRVEKPGETVLMFNHSNLWDPNAAAQETYAVVVTANDDMEISISVVE